MLRNLKSKFVSTVAAAGAAALSASHSMAVSVVDGTVTSQIDDTQADILTVGAAIIGLAVIAMGIRWVKATFF